MVFGMGVWACVCFRGGRAMRRLHKRFRLSNLTGTSSRIDDFFRLDVRDGPLNKKNSLFDFERSPIRS